MSSTEPTLFATAPTVREIERARAVVVLIGSYDGSGNYGDIAQLGAALELVGRLGPGVLALPVLEREYLDDHRELTAGPGTSSPLALFFDPGGGLEDDLLPVAAPLELAFGALYLYGGGYLNRLWGARKLAMLGAAEALLAAGGAEASRRLASGLQAEPEWLASGGAAALGSFDLLGARDSGSRRALATLGSAPGVETGDDVVGLLRRLPTAAAPAPSDERLHLNLHFAEHEWVSERPQAVFDFHTGFVAELGRLAARPLTVQPLIAYTDGRIDERAALARLCKVCADSGAEVAEPLMLRPAGLAEATQRLNEAHLTLSCSYHVALTSLMLGVPALLVGDNPYYEQKAAGLADDFGLPAALTADSTVDPVASAREIAPLLLDAKRAGELRDGLAAGKSRLTLRRTETEAELLARLGSGAATALSDRAAELAERLRERSAEPAQLHVRIAELQTEQEELRRVVDESPVEAELRVHEAEARAAAAQVELATVLESRSWRLAAPLRRLGSALRRR